jgi:Flp pilus assembly protein TadD
VQRRSYNNLGLTLLSVNRDTEAEAALRKALELDPDGAIRHLSLGLTLLLEGKTDDALQEMQQETEGLIGDPRYKAFLRKLKLPE